jgi:hypothetical protein
MHRPAWLPRFIRIGLAAALVAASMTVSAAAADAAPTQVTAPTVRPDSPTATYEGAAMEIARHYGHDVIVTSETTETSQVVAKPDGTWTQQSYAEPVRVQRDGAWKSIDATLSRAADGSLVSAATVNPVKFSGGGTGPLAALQARNGQWVSLGWQQGSLPTPTVDGGTAVYSEALPGIDLQVTATNDGFSEVLVIKNATAARSAAAKAVKFGLASGSLRLTTDEGGALTAVAADGSVQLRQAQPMWWDSTGEGAGPDGPGGNGVPRPLANVTRDAASETIDAGTVASGNGVTFPVYVDPVWGGGRHAYTFTDNAYPTTSYYNGAGASDAYAHSGYVDVANSDDGHAHVTRAYFQMHLDKAVGKHVLTSTLNTVLKYTSSCTATGVTLRSTTAAFTSSTTWSNQPTLSGVLDTQSGAWRSTCQNGGASGEPLGFNALTPVTTAAANGSIYVYLALVSTNEANWQTWKKFANNPSLVTNYNSVPSVPSSLGVTPCFLACSGTIVTSSATPDLSALSTDDDPSATLRYEWNLQVYSASLGWHDQQADAFPLTTYEAGQDIARWHSATSLPTGLQYRYRVRAFDGYDSSDFSGWTYFNVDTTQPPPPSATITSGAGTDPTTRTGTVGAPITVDFSGTSSSVAIIAYSLYNKVSVYSTAPACGTHNKDIVVICRSGGSFPTATVAALDTSSTLSIRGYDTAGNVSSADGSLPMYVNPDTTNVQAGHAWRVNTSLTTTVPDDGTSSPQDLNVGTGVSNAVDAPNPAVTDVDPVTLDPRATPENVSTFTGSGALKTSTALSGFSMSQNFTFTAWVKPTGTSVMSGSATVGYAIAAQEGTSISGFLVDAYRGQYRFCMPTTQNSTFDGVCATANIPHDGSLVPVWAFIIAQWDWTNKTLRLTVGAPGTPTDVEYHASTAAASGVFDVGVRNQPGQIYPFVGSIFAPTVMQAIASTDQLTALSKYAEPSGL